MSSALVAASRRGGVSLGNARSNGASPRSVRSAAPRLGEDTDAVLREIGLTGDQIAALRARKVVA